MNCLESNDFSSPKGICRWFCFQSLVPRGYSPALRACASVAKTLEFEFGIELFHLGRVVPVSFPAMAETDLTAFTPMIFSATCPIRTLQPIAFSAREKCSAIQEA